MGRKLRLAGAAATAAVSAAATASVAASASSSAAAATPAAAAALDTATACLLLLPAPLRPRHGLPRDKLRRREQLHRR